jgi:hypothetical protein
VKKSVDLPARHIGFTEQRGPDDSILYSWRLALGNGAMTMAMLSAGWCNV